MKRWKRPLRAQRHAHFVIPSLEILEVRELLSAAPGEQAAQALLANLAHLRDDLTAATVALLRDVSPANPNAPTPAQMQYQCNTMWNMLAADCQRTWQAFVQYQFATLGLDDLGVHLPGQTISGTTTAPNMAAVNPVPAFVTSTAATQSSPPRATPFSGSPPPPPTYVSIVNPYN